jgi:hypothetical protein
MNASKPIDSNDPAGQVLPQPLLERHDVGVGRHVNADQPPASLEVALAVVEIDLARHPVAPLARLPLRVGTHQDIARLALVHRAGGRERLAARPLLDDARITRGRHRPGAEVGGHPDRVEVLPGDVLLGLRGKVEAVAHETPCLQVEFAHDARVGPAARQGDQAAAIRLARALRPQARGAGPDPVLLLVGRDAIQVDQDFPVWLRLAVLGERRPPPHATRVPGIAPEVEDIVTVAIGQRDALLRVEDREQLLPQRLVARIRSELLLRHGVAGTHPVERPVADDVLEPDVGIFHDRVQCLCSAAGSGDEDGEQTPPRRRRHDRSPRAGPRGLRSGTTRSTATWR